MRILILTISYPPNVGGVETHLADLIQWLEGRSDLEVDLLTYQPITTSARGAALEQVGRARIFRIAWFGRNLFHQLESRPFLQFIYLAPRLLLASILHLLRHGRYDVIHAHGLVAAWVAGWLKRWWKMPVLVSIHAVYSFPPRSPTAARMHRILEGVDHVLALSDASLAQLEAYGLPRARGGRFTYWVDPKIFFPRPRSEARAKHALPSHAMICLFVGRLLEIKGVETIFHLAKCLPDLLFLIAGDGPMEKDCRNATQNLSNLRYLGRMPNEDLGSFYSACDLLLVPSQYEEGFGRVVCEALSCGLPVIAANRGGLKEAIKDGGGLLVEPTVEAFSSAILAWRKKGGSTLGVRQACRTLAKKKFGSANARMIEDSLRQLGNKMTPLRPSKAI